MVLIIAKNPMIKPVLCRTRREINYEVMVAVEKIIFMVAKIFKAVGSGNCEQNKLGVVNTVCLANGGVDCFHGVWMTYCGKSNPWSDSPNAHTTGFHYAAILACANYSLPITHRLHHHLSFNNNRNGTSSPVVNTSATFPVEGMATNDDLTKSLSPRLLVSFVLVRLPFLIKILQPFLALL